MDAHGRFAGFVDDDVNVLRTEGTVVARDTVTIENTDLVRCAIRLVEGARGDRPGARRAAVIVPLHFTNGVVGCCGLCDAGNRDYLGPTNPAPTRCGVRDQV